MLNKIFHHRWLRNTLFTLSLLACAGGLNYFATRYAVQHDATHAETNSLTSNSVDVLKQLNGAVNITVYATQQDAKLGDIRKIIRDFLSLYQRYKRDFNLVFIDPEQEPEKARAANIQLNGEMVIEYAGRNEHLTQINEQTVSSALLRLAHTQTHRVLYLDGHGERKLDGIANFDLGTLFGAKLKQNGYVFTSVNLAVAPDVPDNASALLITQPQVDMLPGEVDKLLRYIDHGGNVLWLLDAEPLHGLERLAEKLDLVFPPGIVIDPSAAQLRAPANWSIASSYTPHAITRNFNLITAFPNARPLMWNENSDWQRHPLIEVAQNGWVSRNAKAKFDKAHDTPGPAIIATTLQRTVQDKEQRVVVVGSGAFLSNTFAGNGGNVDLGINMVNWLSGEERLITLQPRSNPDGNLVLSQTALTIIGAGFLLVLPALLAAVGAWLWWKRRRA